VKVLLRCVCCSLFYCVAVCFIVLQSVAIFFFYIPPAVGGVRVCVFREKERERERERERDREREREKEREREREREREIERERESFKRCCSALQCVAV